MRQVMDQAEAEGRTQGQEDRGVVPSCARQEPRRHHGQQDDGQKNQEIHFGETGEPKEPAGGHRPARGAGGARDQPGEHPGHHEPLGDRLRQRELRKPDLRQRDGREGHRDPRDGHTAQPARHTPQADQAEDREEGRDEEGQLRRAEGVRQGGQDRKQRGKPGGDRRVSDVGNLEAAREACKRPRHVQRHLIPEQRRAVGGRQRAQ